MKEMDDTINTNYNNIFTNVVDIKKYNHHKNNNFLIFDNAATPFTTPVNLVVIKLASVYLYY